MDHTDILPEGEIGRTDDCTLATSFAFILNSMSKCEQKMEDESTENKTSYKPELPADAVLIKQIGSLFFYFSKSQHDVFIEISDYHAGPVKFARSEISDLLNIIDQKTEEKENDLIAELEADDDDF